MNNEEFDKLQRKFRDAIEDIFDAYINVGRGPHDHVIDAFADVFDCTHNEFRKFFAKYARSQGSNLFSAHYPAFGEPGCEFERPD